MSVFRRRIAGAKWLAPARFCRGRLRVAVRFARCRWQQSTRVARRRLQSKILCRSARAGENYARKPLRVLLGSHNLNWEGAPRSLLEIGEGLNECQTFSVEVLAPCDGPLRTQYESIGLRVHVQNLPGCANVVQGWTSREDYQTTLNTIEDFFNRARPDVIVANTLHSFYLVEAAARAGIPALWIIREFYSREAMKTAINGFAFDDCRGAFQKAHRVVFVSDETRRLFEPFETRANFLTLLKALPARACDEYCARVDAAQARAATGAPAHRKIILTLGTVCERKDQITLLRAVATLRRKRDDFCCYIVGIREELAYTREVHKLARELGVSDVVHLVEEIEDVKPFLRAADIFAFTSHNESGSRVLLEAQAFGLPIVTTPCGGTREIVSENANALFFPFSDASLLATHLENLLNDEPMRARMARTSRAVFDTLPAYDEMIARYRHLIYDAWNNG